MKAANNVLKVCFATAEVLLFADGAKLFNKWF